MWDSVSKKVLLVVTGLVVFVVVYYHQSRPACVDRISYDDVDLNSDLDLNRLYVPVDSLVTQHIVSSWRSFDASVDHVDTVMQFEFELNRNIQIIEQITDGHSHFSAVIYPTGYDTLQSYPVAVWANGLNQSNPSVNLRNSTIRKFVRRMSQHFILIPSFRGQALVVSQKRYCSDGFFGDAFDGATDDALRLLQYATAHIESIDESRVTAIGISRGGTVALLMGCRDSSLRNVISISGPTDFYSRQVSQRYGFQYKYQFLSTTRSITDIRAKLLKSSPVHFIAGFPNSILLIQGANDHIVPVSNANAIIQKLKHRENFTPVITDGGHDFYDWDLVMDWLSDQ